MPFAGRTFVVAAALIGAVACGFGTYDGSGSPGVTEATDGVADAGQWWPFVCPDGSNPSPDEPPESFAAAGSCGDGGTLTMNVDGCEVFANWDVLGLSDVRTIQPTSTPALGGWAVTAEDGGWTCTAAIPAGSGAITLTCAAGSPPATVCQSTLSPAGGP